MAVGLLCLQHPGFRAPPPPGNAGTANKGASSPLNAAGGRASSKLRAARS